MTKNSSQTLEALAQSPIEPKCTNAILDVLDEICTPTRNIPNSAYINLYSREDITITNKEPSFIIPLGVTINQKALKRALADIISTDFFEDLYMEVHLREFLRARGLIASANIINIDSTHEIYLVVHKITDGECQIKRGDKVAQLLLKLHATSILEIECEQENYN